MASDTESDNTVSTDDDDDDDDEQPLTHVNSLKSRKEKKVTSAFILNVFLSLIH